MNATQTRYYLIGLYLPDVSVFESVEFGITRHELYFDVSQYEPDCGTVPGVQPACVFKFVRKKYRDSHNNICILASTPTNASEVKYEAQGSPQVDNIQATLIMLGSLGMSTPFYFTLFIFGFCYCVATKILKSRKQKNSRT